MRQIRFRGKDVKTGAWYYGDLLTELTRDGEKKYISFFHEGKVWNPVEVITESVGQFTGMCDRFGNEICEGDIVSWISGRGGGFMEIGHVEWKQEELQYRIVNRFGTKDGRELTHDMLRKRDLTIRGNIHDNPELVKSDCDEE